MTQEPQPPQQPWSGTPVPPPPPPPMSWGQPPPPPGYAPVRPMSESDMRLWAGASWWGTFVGLGFLAPLIVMLTKGNEHPFVRRQAVESLNFQLTMLIAEIVSAVLILALVGILLLPVVIVYHLVITIIGAVRASGGEDYRAPITVRMVS